MEIAAGAALVGGSFLLATARKGGKPRQSGKGSPSGLGSLPAPISAAVVAGAALFLGLKALSGWKGQGDTHTSQENTSEAAALPNGHTDVISDEEEPVEANGSEDVEDDTTEDQVTPVSETAPPPSVSQEPYLNLPVGDVSPPETPIGTEREHVAGRMSSTTASPFNTAPSSPFYSDALPDFDKSLGDGEGENRRERFHGSDWPSAVNVPLEPLVEKDGDSPDGPGGNVGVGNGNDVSAFLKRVKAAAARAESLHSKILDYNNTDST